MKLWLLAYYDSGNQDPLSPMVLWEAEARGITKTICIYDIGLMNYLW